MLQEIPSCFIQFGGSFFLLRLRSDVVVNVRSPAALMWSDCLVYWSETNNRDVICNRWLSAVSGSCLHICGGSFSSSSVHSSNFALLDPADITSRPSVCLNVTEQQSKGLKTNAVASRAQQEVNKVVPSHATKWQVWRHLYNEGLARRFHRKGRDCALVSISADGNETKPGTAGAVEKFNNAPIPNQRMPADTTGSLSSRCIMFAWLHADINPVEQTESSIKEKLDPYERTVSCRHI